MIQRVRKAPARLAEIDRVEADLAERGADVVEGHDDHDQASDEVHPVQRPVRSGLSARNCGAALLPMVAMRGPRGDVTRRRLVGP